MRSRIPHIHQNIASKRRAAFEKRLAARPGPLAISQSFAPSWKSDRLVGSKDSQLHNRKLMASTSETSLNLTIAYSTILMHEVILNYGSVLDEKNLHSENQEI